MKLSICMMVKDEEKNLARCLKSLQPLRDVIESELIIIDTGSKDNTVRIAKEYTDSIYFHDWNNNFSEMRNITISYAKGEWVFIIDGDEVLDDCLDIIKFFNTHDYKQYSAATLYVKNHSDYEEKKLSAVLSSPRLFKNHTITYEGSVHNSPVYKQPAATLNSLIKHYGYILDDKELMEKKFIRTSTLLENELRKDCNNVYYRYQLSVSYNMHGDYEESLREIQKAYNLVKGNKNKMKEHMYIYNQLCRAYLAVGSYKDIEDICLEGIDIQPEYLDLYYYLGTVQIMYNKYDEAINTYTEYINILKYFHNTSIAKDTSIAMYTLNDKETVFYNLAVAYYKKKDYEKAIQYTCQLENDKAIEKSLRIVIDSYVKQSKIRELYKYYLKVISESSNGGNLFEKTLEESKLSYTVEENNYINEQFSNANNVYGELNNIRRLFVGQNSKISEYILKFVTSYNFNLLQDFYGDIINIAVINNLPIEKIIIELDEDKIAEYLVYIANKNQDFQRCIYDYINNFKFDDNIECIKTKMILSRTFLILKDKENLQEYKQVFEEYVNSGVLYMQNIYSEAVFDKELVSELKSESEKFLLYICLADKVKKSDDEKYIKYLKKALSVYPYMKEGIRLLLNEMKEKESTVNNEMEQFKKQVKGNIKSLIEVGSLEKAKGLINEYESIVQGDAEIVLLKSEIMLSQAKNKSQEFRKNIILKQ